MKQAPDITNILKQKKPEIKNLGIALKQCKEHAVGKITTLDVLKKSLQTAVEIEFATIPPYLCAIWSIKDDLHPVAKSIREILQEEMLHLAFACNMLTAIGGKPILNDPPMYPSKLPGGVHSDLTVHLSGMCQSSIRDFMEIEMPEEVIPISGETVSFKNDDHKTIGEFYDGIEQAFEYLNSIECLELNPDRQLSGPLSWFVLTDIEGIKTAIHLIKRQGEGATTPQDTSDDDLAHFYRFWEIYKGKRIIKSTTGKDKYCWGSDLPCPDVWPVATIPAGGYQKNEVSPGVWELLEKFDETYTEVIDLLHAAWNETAGQDKLVRAVEVMFSLQKYAIPLMKIPVACGTGKNYGPCFRIKR